MGRKALPAEEKQKRRKQQLEAAMQLRRDRNQAGLCRQCGEVLAASSKVYCDRHLQAHRQNHSYIEDRLPVSHVRYRRVCACASDRGIEMGLNKEEFASWYESEEKVCCYCGVPEELFANHKDKKQRRLTVDRKDSKRGYVLDNLSLACFRCNNTKSDFFTFSEWRSICDSIVKSRIEEYHKLRAT